MSAGAMMKAPMAVNRCHSVFMRPSSCVGLHASTFNGRVLEFGMVLVEHRSFGPDGRQGMEVELWRRRRRRPLERVPAPRVVGRRKGPSPRHPYVHEEREHAEARDERADG